MAKDAAKPFAHIEVIPATLEQEPVLANLLELYAYDFSEFHDLILGEDGRFGYESLPRYWSEPNRHPFLVRNDGKLAGFALVKRGSEVSGNDTAWDMAEFFVLRGYRRRGIGTQTAHQLWRQFSGLWEVRVMESNVSACQFWARAISTYTGFKSKHLS
jgi:predicted acetyltransferase